MLFVTYCVQTSAPPDIEMTLGKSLTAVCLKLPGRCILITWDVHRSLWLVSVYGELSGGTVYQAGLLPKATASNSCQNNIGLSKLSPDSTLYLQVAE
jgi:hypothetical protein